MRPKPLLLFFAAVGGVQSGALVGLGEFRTLAGLARSAGLSACPLGALAKMTCCSSSRQLLASAPGRHIP